MLTHDLIPYLFTAIFKQCTLGRLVSIKWQLNLLHVSQAIIRKQIYYILRVAYMSVPTMLR